MKKIIKRKSLNQAVWRSKFPKKWQQLEPENVVHLIGMRMNGMTYQFIASVLGITAEAVRKQCIKAGLPKGHAKAIFDPLYGSKIKTYKEMGEKSPFEKKFFFGKK